jgi:hypothetical protein
MPYFIESLGRANHECGIGEKEAARLTSRRLLPFMAARRPSGEFE